MAGLNHFAQVRARVFQDPKVHEAGRRLSEAQRIPEEWALSTVAGLCAAVDLWLIRETDDGVAPGDGTAMVRASAFVPPAAARAAMQALVASGLFEKVREGVRRVGFEEDYRELLYERRAARERREARKGAPPPTPRVVRPSDDGRTTVVRPSSHDSDQRSKTLTAEASDSPDPEPAVDSASSNGKAGTATAGPSGSSSKPDGRGPAPPPCRRCVDGLQPRRGSTPPRTCGCPRGRDRARNMARAYRSEDAASRRAEDARRDAAAGRRGGPPQAIAELLPELAQRLGLQPAAGPFARAGPGGPDASGPRHPAA